jgi:hypothetical protein
MPVNSSSDLPRLSVDRRRMARFPVSRPIIGHVVEVGQSVTLQDISAGGFSAMAAVTLTPGTAYECRFVLPSESIAVHARLAYSMRVSGTQTSAYLLGFEFVQTGRDDGAVAALIEVATGR